MVSRVFVEMIAEKDFDEALFRLNNRAEWPASLEEPQLHPLLLNISKHTNNDQASASQGAGTLPHPESQDLEHVVPLLRTSIADEAAFMPPQTEVHLCSVSLKYSTDGTYDADSWCTELRGTAVGGYVTVRDFVHGVLAQQFKEGDSSRAQAEFLRSVEIYRDDYATWVELRNW